MTRTVDVAGILQWIATAARETLERDDLREMPQILSSIAIYADLALEGMERPPSTSPLPSVRASHGERTV